jgi:hypothetical protein
MAVMRDDRGRVATGAALMALACLLAVVAHASRWVDGVALDADGFVEAMAPLSDDDAVTDALAASVTASVLDAVGAGGGDGETPTLLELTFEQEAAMQLLGDTFGDTIEQLFTDGFRSDSFDPLWEDGLRRAHADFLDQLDDPGGTFTLQVTSALADADAELEAMGLDIFDDEAVEELSRVEVLRNEQLGRARWWLDTLDTVGPFALPLAVAAAVAAVAVTPRRRWTIVGGGLGLAACVALFTAALGVSERRASSGAEAADRPAVEASWDALTASLDDRARLLVVAGLVVAAVALAAGALARRSGAHDAPEAQVRGGGVRR